MLTAQQYEEFMKARKSARALVATIERIILHPEGVQEEDARLAFDLATHTARIAATYVKTEETKEESNNE